jgi:transposase
MSKKKRKTTVVNSSWRPWADHEKGYSIAEASRNLGVEYSVLRRWKKQLTDDPKNAFPGKGKLKAGDESCRLKRELERVKRSATS